MYKLDSLAACSSASDLNQPGIRDVVDVFGVDASSGDILQLHLEKDSWLQAQLLNPYQENGTRFSGPITVSALNPDRVDLLGAGPNGEMLHCYTDPQLWHAEEPVPGALVPNSQTTALWWNDAGSNRLDLFAVTADLSNMVQYTAIDPGTGNNYTWNHNPLGNPASFTNGALTSIWPSQDRIDIFGLQATGTAAQLYHMRLAGWQASANLGASYPVGTTLVACSRRNNQWDIFGIDQNGKLLSFYYYYGNGWATRQLDMPVSGGWKLSAGCARAADQIDLFFVDAASGILRVALTDMDSATIAVDAEVIYPFRLRQADLEKFKAMFPEDEQLQRLSLDDLVKYSQGKDPSGESAQPSSNPPPQSGRGALTPCQWAWGKVAVDVVFLLLGISDAVKSKLALDEATALGAEMAAEIEHHLHILADSSASLYNKAVAIVLVGKMIYEGALFGAIYKAIVRTLDWWDMVLYGVAGLAEITAAFLTDGAALIAKIIYSIITAGHLVTDVHKALEICGEESETQMIPALSPAA